MYLITWYFICAVLVNSTCDDASESSSDSEDDSDYNGTEEEKEISGDELNDIQKHTDFNLPGFRQRVNWVLFLVIKPVISYLSV